MATISPLQSSLADRLKLLLPVTTSTALASGATVAYAQHHSLPIAVMAGTIAGAALFLFLLKVKSNSLKVTPSNMQRILDCAESLAGFGTFTLRICNESETFTTWSPQFRCLLGVDISNVPLSHAQYIEHFVHTEDQQRVRASLENTLKERSSATIEYRIRRECGSLRHVLGHLEYIRSADSGDIFHGQLHDITGRKQAQEELVRSHVELKRLIGALDAVREDEQKRLAREMHDDLGQLLAAMKMDLSTLAQQLPPSEGGVLQRLDGINDLVNSMMISVRRIIADLPPKLLDDVGLIDALQLLARNFESRYGVSCHLHLPGREPDFRGNAASMLYRLVQESLNNVAKHAQATSVNISLEVRGSSLLVSIVDNGRGASEIDLAKHGSFGLICMRERVVSFDGELRIETSPGAGMAVHVSLPLPEAAVCPSTPGTHKAKAPST